MFKNLFFSILITIGLNVQAADSSSGCGLGWAVFEKNSLISSALRSTTNALFLNTLAMTSGTSGCAQHSIVKSDKKTLHFIDANKHHLMSEMAFGKGENLTALSEILGCNEKTFSEVMKKNYKEIFRSDNLTARQLTNLVKVQMITNLPLRKDCGLI